MSHPDSVFRSNGALLTSALFYEIALKTNSKDTSKAIFSMEGKTAVEPMTGRPLMDARALFVSLEDSSGLKFSKEYLEGFDHFKRLEKSTTFQPFFEAWRAEIDAVLQERALRVVRGLMMDEEVTEGTRLSAAKYIAGKQWEGPTKATRGRPSKTEVDKELKKAVAEKTAEETDAARLGLRLVKGNKK